MLLYWTDQDCVYFDIMVEPWKSDNMTLEEKLTRLKEIQQTLTTEKVNLSESIKMLEEAMKLKKEIDTELSELENKLISLTRQGEVSTETNF